ncbi:uncharacterized protein LOC126980849 isoform X1 [Eriocheir sinensis]|uniref:uncharacterized protein LOC126980849 isoform X1 n=1 Tax=Eriocheir sinensis TaxID=95602 RepID=UPI0021C9C09A|nr:uncharacterized protein LOC126980849 isoform X1 [Eriocheir sinensis]XP_050687107.1 uncharacterized protein LOC126980849 isoform X1 [Eriocheir sinensis]
MKTLRETLAFVAQLAVGLALYWLLRGAVPDTREVSKLRRAWEASGPQTTVVGKVRGRLADSWWLGPLRPAPLRDPFAECGLLPLGSPGAGGLLEGLSLQIHSRAILDCLQRQMEVALGEHEAFTLWLQVAAGCGLLFVFLVACSLLLGRSRSRRGLPQEEAPQEEEEASLPGTPAEDVPVAVQEAAPAEARPAQAEEEESLPGKVSVALQEAATVEARQAQVEEEESLPGAVSVALQESAPVEARQAQAEEEASLPGAVPVALQESAPVEARQAQVEEEASLPGAVPVALQESAPVEARPAQAEEDESLPGAVSVALQESAPVEARPAQAEEDESLPGAVSVALQESAPVEARPAQAEEEESFPGAVSVALQESAPVEARLAQAEEEESFPGAVSVALQESAPVEARPALAEEDASVPGAVPVAVPEIVTAEPRPAQAEQPGAEARQALRQEWWYTHHLPPRYARRLLDIKVIRSLRSKSCAQFNYDKTTKQLLVRGPKHDALAMHNAIRDMLATFERQDKKAAAARRRQQWWRYTLYMPPRYVRALLGPESTYLNNLLARYNVKVDHDPTRRLVHVQGPRNDALTVYRAIQEMLATWRWQEKPQY